VAEAAVRLLRRAEPGELAHRPRLAAVHGLVDAAGERVAAGVAQVAVVVEVDVARPVERLEGDARDRRALGLRGLSERLARSGRLTGRSPIRPAARAR